MTCGEEKSTRLLHLTNIPLDGSVF